MNSSLRHLRRALVTAVTVLGLAWGSAAGGAAAGLPATAAAAPATGQPGAALPNTVVPAPVSAVADGTTYRLTASATLSSDVPDIGAYLAGVLRASTGFALPLSTGASGPGTIALQLSGAPAVVGDQGYQLTVTTHGVVLRANRPAGLFAGVQTLLQLLPASVESPTVVPGPWTVPGGTVTDYPRFAYRGAMLDVARHFFTVAQVERYIDELALYKINYLHLHLSDDQGWRIAIAGWPQLARYGGSTEVGGGPGGWYSQADYSAIVAYAASRYLTVVPEIDLPGHTNAALASYPQLNCDGVAPGLYTGTDVGFSSLCVPLQLTYTFIDQVVGEIAALTPGPYLHIGGDEATSTTAADYASFIDRAQQIVAAHGKTVIGWHDIANATLLPSTVAQFWDTSTTDGALATAAAHGTKVIMSPANKAYLDMKYTHRTKLGQDWAGLTDVNTAYGWNPGGYLSGVGATSVLGVEAPLWTETIVTPADLDYMAFPRLPAIAELGWSPWSTHGVSAFDHRLGAQGPRWKALGIGYYHSTQVSWPAGS
ncbi:beta-N-acetylhexosaminidase [Kitasatospora nipponensis]|uniref:beta-N-acetylhexosaminidase n=1 Tax=Kitasatospora nipponensis TaxID=258049 RepID=A0ABN1WHS4_9ACTN